MAVDSARVALRLGAKEVSIVYRRSSEEMPAIRGEIGEAEKEGVKIRYLSSPCQILSRDGKCAGMECFETELGEPDERGRRRPIPVRGSEFAVEADMVISAIGQVPDLSFLDGARFDVAPNSTIKVNPHTLATAVDGVFAGGDVVSGPATVIEAIAAGRKAALSIDRYLRGEQIEKEEPPPHTIALEDVDVAQVKKRRRERMPALSPMRRIRGFREVELGLGELAALGEADRCLQCGMFPKKPGCR